MAVKHHTGGFNEAFLAENYKLLEPFIDFFQSKCNEIKKNFLFKAYQKANKSQYIEVLETPMLIKVDCIETISKTYEKMKHYYNHPDYEKNRKAELKELEERGLLKGLEHLTDRKGMKEGEMTNE